MKYFKFCIFLTPFIAQLVYYVNKFGIKQGLLIWVASVVGVVGTVALTVVGMMWYTNRRKGKQ